MTSIKDVAKLAGVSTATVSRCLNSPDLVKEKTRTKVLAAIEASAYSPNALAQNFRRGKTNLVLIVLSKIGDPFFTRVMSGIQAVAKEKNYSILITETQPNTVSADEFSKMLVSKQADGIILLAAISPFGTNVLSEKSHRRLPMVIGGEALTPELEHIPSVHIDNVAAATEATEYLLALGHRSVGFIFGSHSNFLTKDREKGFRLAMQRAKLAIKDGWIVEGKLSLEGAIKATRKLLGHSDPPSAIFCATDEMAMGTLHAIQSAGLRVPEDISVLGFDDIRFAKITNPPLTTIAQPVEEIGQRVMNKLCHLMDTEYTQTDPRHEIVGHKLIIRASTGPVKK